MTAAVTADLAAVDQAKSVRGRNRIAPRAVRRVVSAVTAEALGVSPSDVSVELTDEGGAVALTAKSPIHVEPLGETGLRSGGTLVDRLGTAQSTIRDRSLQLTGSTVSRVDLQITGVALRQKKGRVE